MEDLWPSDLTAETSKIQTPAGILKEQGSFLGQRTSNVIIGEIKKVDTGAPDIFMYVFVLVCSALKYRYSLFTLKHDITLYPITLWLKDDDVNKEMNLAQSGQLTIQNQDQFKETLKKIFHTEKVKRIISAVLSQI